MSQALSVTVVAVGKSYAGRLLGLLGGIGHDYKQVQFHCD
jgi:hypothetical protein